MQRPTRQPLSLAGFFIGIVVGALLVWGMSAAWVEFFPASVLSPRYSRNVAEQTMMHRCTGNDVVIFGDSRARTGIDPDGLDIPAINLAEGAYNPAVDFYRARDLLRCASHPRVVILSYSTLLFRVLAPFLMNDFFIDRLLTDSEIREIVSVMDKTNDWAILSRGEPASIPPLQNVPLKIRTVLYRVDFPIFYAPSILASLESGVAPRWHANQQTYDSTIRNGGQYPHVDSQKSDAVFSDAETAKYPRSAVMDLYFEKLIALLTENGIPILILTMPINRPTFDAVGPEQRQVHDAYLHSFAAGRPNVGVIEPVLASWPSDMFADIGGHPNRRGETEVTRLVNRCIEAVLAAAQPVDAQHAIDPQKCSMDHHAF